MNGLLYVRFETGAICAAGECLGIGYAWSALGPSKREVMRVLSQWNGAEVEAEGTLQVEKKAWYENVDPRRPWQVLSPGKWLEILRRGLRTSRLVDVSYLKTIRLPPSESYCLGYQGPGLPSPSELELRELETADRRSAGCHVHGWAAHDSVLCVDAVEPVIWRRVWEPVPFHPPPPYATRDVVDFEAITDSVYLFTLPNKRLYGWTGSESVEIGGPVVEGLESAFNGWVYYRERQKPESSAVAIDALRRVDQSLRPETLWRSSRGVLERFETSPLAVWVKHSDGAVRRLVYESESKTWTPRRGGN